LVLVTGLAVACGNAASTGEPAHGSEPGALEPLTLEAGEKLAVVATTNIVGDVVAQVAGDRIDLVTLMGTGVDPHSYVPTPADTAAIYDADVVLISGGGLEANMENVLESAGGEASRVSLFEGIEPLPAGSEAHEAEDAGEEADHDHGDVDPHVWFSVPNVIHWVDRIEQTLSALDPANAGHYQENARAYIAELEALDGWIMDQVALIPEGNRRLVTNHPVFGYFAARYGLEQVGAVYPVSPAAEPSAQEIAALQDAIQAFGVPAVFTESTVNPKLAEQVAEDTGVQLVPLYTGSLGEPGSGAGTYLDMMRYDVEAIVEALR
jgi:ABC-type Zn uptake system ZnuABC Zn-binding protein ZnuA